MEITPKAAKLPCAYSSPYSAESSPSGFKNEKHRSGLSASLRERLKRTRRSFISPLSVAKRLCVDSEEEEGNQVSADCQETVIHSVDANRTEVKLDGERLSGPAPQPAQINLEDLALRLRKEVKEKTETLRRLKLVKMYRSKNNLTQLQTLIDKWRSCAQAALYELQSEFPVEGRKADLSELIDLFGLDDSILCFDRAEGDFTT
ncbi:hypothetical protein CHARACLAT_024496 [Characodon lateralis]|uniref:Swi5-dependent recombination DNA repair protein 1 homolog n=1 Tax=Characodon lateralis TaxID=208331 RepID=A0ABU7F7S6_9TELE|nr:hypothetical protein [Characodon lateralis]